MSCAYGAAPARFSISIVPLFHRQSNLIKSTAYSGAVVPSDCLDVSLSSEFRQVRNFNEITVR